MYLLSLNASSMARNSPYTLLLFRKHVSAAEEMTAVAALHGRARNKLRIYRFPRRLRTVPYVFNRTFGVCCFRSGAQRDGPVSVMQLDESASGDNSAR